MTETAQTIVRVIVSGQVQGVGYRAFVEAAAARLELDGWVRNRRDRSVEAVLAGPAPAVEEALAALRMGPPGARVDNMAVEAAGAADLQAEPAQAGFHVRPTL